MGKHYISLFGEKSVKEGHVEVIQNYGNIVVEEDIGVASTKICRSCCLHDGMLAETLTHVFWENGVHYPRVSPGAQPLTKKPEDSGFEIGDGISERCTTC